MHHYNIKCQYMKLKFIGNNTEIFLSDSLSYIIFIMQLLNRFIILYLWFSIQSIYHILISISQYKQC